MKKFAYLAIPLVLTLAACGKSDDASTEAEADTVEMPADDAMATVTETPEADDAANAAAPAIDAASEAAAQKVQQTAQQAGESAAEVAARAQAAAAAAAAATGEQDAKD